MTNCPNCGAPIDNYHCVKCPHCGTDYYDFAPMELGKPFYMKFKKGGKTMIARVVLSDFNINQSARRSNLYVNNKLISTICANPETEMDIHLCVVDEEDTLNGYRPGLIIVDEED